MKKAKEVTLPLEAMSRLGVKEEALQPQAMMMKRGGASAPEPSLGMDVQHHKTLHVNADIWYRVSEFI